MRRAVRSLTAAAALSVFLALPLGCDEGSSGPEGPKAVLQVTFEPNPVVHVGPGNWEYLVYISEAGGVGIHIYGFKIQNYTDADTEGPLQEEDSGSFSALFRDCGGEGKNILAGATRCWRTETLGTEFSNSGYQIWTFFGVDDLGNEVEGSGRVEFL